jgi:uncharacterized membrane protein
MFFWEIRKKILNRIQESEMPCWETGKTFHTLGFGSVWKPHFKSTHVVKQYQFQLSHCHRKPERSFFWKGKQFPVCARCTGIHLGYLSFPLFLFSVISLNFWITILMIVPTLVDGLTQAFLKRESNNLLRVTTGLMAGIGAMSMISIIGNFLGDQILFILK